MGLPALIKIGPWAALSGKALLNRLKHYRAKARTKPKKLYGKTITERTKSYALIQELRRRGVGSGKDALQRRKPRRRDYDEMASTSKTDMLRRMDRAKKKRAMKDIKFPKTSANKKSEGEMMDAAEKRLREVLAISKSNRYAWAKKPRQYN